MSTCLVAGSTGLVGSFLVKKLADNGNKVFALTRKEEFKDSDEVKHIKVDFDSLNLSSDQIEAIDDVFICLGTTIKKAGSKENFKKIDVDYCLSVANQSLNLGAKNLSLVTSIGSDKNSKNFYLSTKGLVEYEISKLSYESISIYRPGLLIGSREEARLGEFIGQLIQPLLIDPFLGGAVKKYKSIKAEVLADFISDHSGKSQGINFYDYRDFGR